MDTALAKEELQRAVSPLRRIFWGGILCVFDITFTMNGHPIGFKFDILDDFIGWLLMTSGVFQLGKMELARSYRKGMGFVKVICVISTFKAFMAHFIFEKPEAVSTLMEAYGLAELAAVLVFCAAMRLFCRMTSLESAAQSWATTTWLFAWLYVLPVGGLFVARLYSLLIRTPLNVNLGPAALLLFLPIVLPIIHLFVSTSRMARAAEEAVTR